MAWPDLFRLNQDARLRLLEPVERSETIPRKIHQTAPQTALVPEIRENIERLCEQNPGWKYRYYDDSDSEAYVAENFPKILPYFRRIDPAYGAARADLFRYLVVYREGGVYLDIKSTFRKPLDKVIRADDKFLLSHWPNKTGQAFQGWGKHWSVPLDRGEFQQCFIVSLRGHPFLENVIARVLANIDRYSSFLHGVGLDAVLRVTGPAAYTLAILPMLSGESYRMVESDVDLGFVYTIFGQDCSVDHQNIFNTHYSLLKGPVVRQRRIMRMLDTLHTRFVCRNTDD